MIAEGAIPKDVVVSDPKTATYTLASVVQCSYCGAQSGMFGIGFEESAHNRMMPLIHSQKCRDSQESDIPSDLATKPRSKHADLSQSQRKGKQLRAEHRTPTLVSDLPKVSSSFPLRLFLEG